MDLASTSEQNASSQLSPSTKERSISGITYQELDLDLLSDIQQVMNEKITKLVIQLNISDEH